MLRYIGPFRLAIDTPFSCEEINHHPWTQVGWTGETEPCPRMSCLEKDSTQPPLCQYVAENLTLAHAPKNFNPPWQVTLWFQTNDSRCGGTSVMLWKFSGFLPCNLWTCHILRVMCGDWTDQPAALDNLFSETCCSAPWSMDKISGAQSGRVLQNRQMWRRKWVASVSTSMSPCPL